MWTEWKHVQSNGTIPSDLLPCTAIQMRWFCMWDYDIVDTSRMTDELKGSWTWQIVDAGNRIYFKSQVKCSIQFTWMSFGMGFAFTTWSWNSASDRVLTTFPEWSGRPLDASGNPVWANPTNWRGTSVPYAPATEQPYFDPGGGDCEVAAAEGSGEDRMTTFTIYTTWHSGIYNVQIPAGCKWQVPFHNVGATDLSKKLANLEMRTSKGGDLGSCFDIPGILRSPTVEQGLALQGIYKDGVHRDEQRRILTEFNSPQLLKTRSNVLYCLGEKGMYWKLLRSTDDGYTWKVVTDLWEPGYNNARFLILPDNAILSIATKGGVTYSKRSEGGYRVYVTNEAVAPCSLAYDARRGAVMTDAEGSTWCSKDCGFNWEPGS